MRHIQKLFTDRTASSSSHKAGRYNAMTAQV